METMTKAQFIIDAIKNMDENELINLNNTYAQSIDAPDDEVYENNEETLQMFFGSDIMRAIQATQYGKYNYHDNYVRFNGYGNLDSFKYFEIDDLCEFVETMAEYIADNEDEFSYLIDFTEFNNQ